MKKKTVWTDVQLPVFGEEQLKEMNVPKENIKIEPIILQRPKNKLLDDAYVFSQTGEWVKTLAFKEGDDEIPPDLLIYHTGDMYPQGLSLPILCGYTKENGFGGFMDHETWGPCYVELDSDFPDKLFVYKLNDGLKMLAEQALGNVTK